MEPRRLLAAGFDPTFGVSGEAFTVLGLPFAASETTPVSLQNLLVPQRIARLDGGYFVLSSHLDVADDSTILEVEDIHALVDDRGTPGELSGGEDGLRFVPTDETAPDTFIGPGTYRDVASLPDGSALAVLAVAADNNPQVNPEIIRLRPDGSRHPFFGVREVSGVRAIEFLGNNIAVLLREVEADDAGSPVTDADLLYEVQLFDATSGALIEDAVTPFGDWLRLDRTFSQPTLHVGRDGGIYVATLTTDLDGDTPDPTDSGFLIARLRLVGQELRLDPDFGATDLPGQETPAVYLPSGQPATANVHAFDFIGATPDGRAWVRVPHPQSQQPAKAFARLTADGALDADFGAGGVVVVNFLPVSTGNVAAQSPVFTGTRGADNDPDGLPTAEPRPFVRGDGSLVGVTAIPQGTSLQAGVELAVGVYGLTPDGEFDPRIAESDSTFGTGRTIVTLDLDDGTDSDGAPTRAVVHLDEQDRLVIASALEDFNAPSDPDVPVDLLVARILLDVPQTQVVVREDGTRVFEITGTTGNDRLILRSGFGGVVELYNSPIGAGESLANVFDPGEFDRIEFFGGEGDDRFDSQLGDLFDGFVTLFGGAGDDTLSSGGRFDRVMGEEGDDSLAGGLGDQLIFGGIGNDTLFGGAGRDALFGEEGDDVLAGQLEGDLLDGGEGNDTLEGNDGNDTLVVGAGDDQLVGGETLDEAEADQDLLWLSGDTAGGVVELFNGTVTVAGGSATVTEIERVLGGSGDDVLVGDDDRNFLFGGDGNDTLMGLGGKDTLLGGNGSDSLDGGDDTDLLLDLSGFFADSAPDALFGGDGADLALADEEDELEESERVFNTLDDLLAEL